MKNLVLTNEETKTLKYWGVVEITRNGFNMLVEYDEIYEDYRITIINPYKKVCLAKEPKRNVKKVLAAVFDPKKMHPYDVKTTGKHPVHMIEGGEYLTESEEIFNEGGEMGWFWLNRKEYDYFKSQLKEVEIEIEG